jgi:hypothetical protein
MMMRPLVAGKAAHRGSLGGILHVPRLRSVGVRHTRLGVLQDRPST